MRPHKQITALKAVGLLVLLVRQRTTHMHNLLQCYRTAMHCPSIPLAPTPWAPPVVHRCSRDVRLCANAPAVEARRTVPLPKEELVNYIASGCKPKDQWRCVCGAPGNHSTQQKPTCG